MSQMLRYKIPPEYYKQHFSQIVFKTSFKNCVLMAMRKRGWKQLEQPEIIEGVSPALPNQQWNLQWCEKQRVNDVFQQGLSIHQRVNHFRLYTQLCRKDMLMKNVKRFKYELKKKKQLVEEDWNFLPPTYFLPSEYIMFAEQFKKTGGLWILKPTGRCQGSGIFLVDKLSQVAPYKTKPNQNQNNNINQKPPLKKKPDPNENDINEIENADENEQNPISNQTYIIQKYIEKPLLLGRKKFDMRIYVLCTDYQNLTVWLYRNGFARFTHQPYSNQNIDNLGGHLTNVQIQKHCDNYDSLRGGKWLLNEFKLYLLTRFTHSKVDQCFTSIQNIILNSLKAVQSKLLPSKSSFELYGYDFMLDQNLKPWLIQVNGGPSMSANTELDCELKCGLVDDVLSIIDLQGLINYSPMTIGGFDLIMSKGVRVVETSQYENHTNLGCMNQRKKVMKAIGNKIMQIRRKQKIEITKDGQKKQEEKEKKKTGLPNFYQERKKKQINQQAKQNLKHQYQILNSNPQQPDSTNFRPLLPDMKQL